MCNDQILPPKHSDEILDHLESFNNSLETITTPLQRLENWPVARAIVSGLHVFEPHLRGLQARAQGVHPEGKDIVFRVPRSYRLQETAT